MNRILPTIAIIISVAALGLSLLCMSKAQNTATSEEEIKKIIVAELEARDQAHIAFLAPKAKMVYQDMLTPDRFNPATFEPKSYEDLLTPLFTVISGMHGHE